FHASIARATPEDGHGLPDHQRQAVEFNFTTVRPHLDDPADRARLDGLCAWTNAEYARLESLLQRRKSGGYIRECHGDLHLGNIVLTGGRPTLFDGIEFNEDLRWIDILNELAFLVMDLEVNGAVGLAWRLLNHYLAMTGDYEGMALFDYYRLYRAMVRAKIAWLSRIQMDEANQMVELLARYHAYVDYGFNLIQPKKPRLFIAHGLSGSGKSRLSARLAEYLPAIHLRSDVERKRLAGFAAGARSHSTEADGIYGADMTEKTYRRLVELAEALLKAGYSVIVDATFIKRDHRNEQRRLAERCGADFLILDCRASDDVLRQRILARAAAGNDPSEADLSVLEYQTARREPLAENEWDGVRKVDMDGEFAVDEICRQDWRD
ncbi:AAA family ATPase, partial [Methylomagnum sp.]